MIFHDADSLDVICPMAEVGECKGGGWGVDVAERCRAGRGCQRRITVLRC